MRPRLFALTSCGLFVAAAAAAAAGIPLRVTQRDLIPLCLNGAAVPDGRRSWEVEPGDVSFVFTMRQQPRPGRSLPDPGHAAITFVAEPGHRYEVEVRAEPAAFSARAWSAAEWLPVVRDRTTDRIVSSEPAWGARGCAAAR